MLQALLLILIIILNVARIAIKWTIIAYLVVFVIYVFTGEWLLLPTPWSK